MRLKTPNRSARKEARMGYWQTLLLMYPLSVVGFRAGALGQRYS